MFSFKKSQSESNPTTNVSQIEPGKSYLPCANDEKEGKKTIVHNVHKTELTKEQALEIIAWQTEHGYPSLDNEGDSFHTDYDTYSITTLKDLVANDDRVTLLKLLEFRSN